MKKGREGGLFWIARSNARESGVAFLLGVLLAGFGFRSFLCNLCLRRLLNGGFGFGRFLRSFRFGGFFRSLGFRRFLRSLGFRRYLRGFRLRRFLNGSFCRRGFLGNRFGRWGLFCSLFAGFFSRSLCSSRFRFCREFRRGSSQRSCALFVLLLFRGKCSGSSLGSVRRQSFALGLDLRLLVVVPRVETLLRFRLGQRAFPDAVQEVVVVDGSRVLQNGTCRF